MPCTFPGCTRRHYAKGLCQSHYEIRRREGAVRAITPQGKNPAACTVAACSAKPVAGGLCSGHYQQHQRGVAFHPLKRRGPSVIEVFEHHAEVVLVTLRSAEKARALIDLADVALVGAHRWRAHGGRGRKDYVNSHGAGMLHRFLMDCPDGLEVDHIDGDPLNNRRANLRVVTHAENSQNVARTGREADRGVHRERGGTFMAHASTNGRVTFTCGLPTEEDARREAARLRSALFTHVVESRHSG